MTRPKHPATTFRVKLTIPKTGRIDTHDLYPETPVTPTTIVDAINRQFKSKYKSTKQEDQLVKLADRITFEWEGHPITLSNPAKDGKDPKPWGDDEWSKRFYDSYFQNQPQPSPKEEETQPEKKEEPKLNQPPWLTDPKGLQNDPSKLFGKTAWQVPQAAQFQPVGKDPYDHKADWQGRWDDVMQRSRDIRVRDEDRARRRDKIFNDAYTHLGETFKGIGNNPFNGIKAVFDVLVTGIQTGFRLVAMIPEEIVAMAERFQLNTSIIGLSIERIYVIGTSILQYIIEVYKMLAMLDWEGATKLLNAWIKKQQEAVQFGMDSGIMNEDGVMGFEQWKIPNAAPNSDKELQLWLAIASLANSPFIGDEIKTQMRFFLLQRYQQMTGVGIPNDAAWIKYILGNQIGVTVPLQEASDMTSTVPDWFMAHTNDFSKLSRAIHAEQHEEIKKEKH